MIELKLLSSFFADYRKCPWCKDNTLDRNNPRFAKCCGQLYHDDGKLLYTFGIHPIHIICPHCNTVNFGQPFLLPLDWHDHLKAKL